jgi:hypothetical protein
MWCEPRVCKSYPSKLKLYKAILSDVQNLVAIIQLALDQLLSAGLGD